MQTTIFLGAGTQVDWDTTRHGNRYINFSKSGYDENGVFHHDYLTIQVERRLDAERLHAVLRELLNNFDEAEAEKDEPEAAEADPPAETEA